MREDIIIGRNPVIEAMKAGHEIDKLFVLKGLGEGQLTRLVKEAKANGLLVTEVVRQKLDEMAEGENHQGVIALAAACKYVSVEDIIEIAKQKNEPPFIIIADGITDPHNLGAIIRTANAVGVHGVIIPKHRSVGLSYTVAKTSAGAVEYTRVAKVTNIARTIEELKELGLWIAGADMDGTQPLFTANLKGAFGLVIGSEGEGISRLVKEKCDFLIKIPMVGEISSLNASVAGAVMMYEVLRQRS